MLLLPAMRSQNPPADNESVFCYSTLVSKHAFKPFEYNNNVFDTGEPTAAMKEKAIDELWKGKLVENYAKYDENGSRISPTMEDQKRFSNNDRDSATDPLISDMTDEENLPNRSELECSSKAEDFIHGNENEPKNSAVSSTSALDLFETDTNVYTDKNITECELLELVMSSKEVNYPVVKDICIDAGIPKEETTAGGGLTGSCLEYSKEVAVNEL